MEEETAVLDVQQFEGHSLMEALKSSGYDLLAACGGMALCASCRIEIEKGIGALAEPFGQELDTLDVLPDAAISSRLSCQLKVNQEMDGMHIRIPKS
ncbi:(2Fe-2S)-binding protein [Mucilaginibacter pineti]|uniref:(2Fe-2S)-binding protein n=1 Tax=Mucilaginibacter pineti TaxID=1391627 RepID=UPI0021D2BA4D|nr:(2Fe-2S)-binding protein [Mucilaginibacter pineti]